MAISHVKFLLTVFSNHIRNQHQNFYIVLLIVLTNTPLTRAGAEAIIRCGDLRSEFTTLLTIARKKRESGFTTRKKERANSLQLRPHGLKISASKGTRIM